MDDTEDDARYPRNPYGLNQQQGYGSSNRQKLPVRNAPYSRPIDGQYVDDDDDDEFEDEDLMEEEENNNQTSSLRYVGKDMDDEDDDEDEYEEDMDELAHE